MHSTILAGIINFTWNFITNYEFPWDNFSFTLYDVILFQILLFVFIFAIRELFMFYGRKHF